MMVVNYLRVVNFGMSNTHLHVSDTTWLRRIGQYTVGLLHKGCLMNISVPSVLLIREEVKMKLVLKGKNAVLRQ